MKNLIIFLFVKIIIINKIYCQNFPPLSKHAIGLRFNRYGRSEFDYSDQDPIRNCGKRKRTVEINRKCFRQCQSDADCRGSKRKCLCDGECGLSCVRITTVCQKIGEFANGYVNYYPDNYFGAQLVYDCNPGYTLSGDKIRICEGDGWWSGTSPICIKETFCDPPKPTPNAIPNIQVFNESKYKSGTEVEYQCDIGYTLNSEQELSKIVCMDNGKWSDVKFKCNRINCGKPDEIENGIIKGNDFFYSSVIEYKCANGYRIKNGDYLRECGLDSKWSGRKPICEPIDCGEPPYVKNAILNYNSTRYNNKAKYTCINSKFYIEKNDFVTCQSNGRWSEPAVVCVEKTCRLDPAEYSLKKYNLFTSNPTMSLPLSDNFNYSIDTSVKFICESGYMLSTNYNEIICVFNPRDETLKWNMEAPKCRKENYCPFIAPPDNGLITSDKKQSPQGYPVNSTIEFKCALGYILKGTNNLTCVEFINKDLVYEAKWSKIENNNFCEPISNLIQNKCRIEKKESILWDKSVGESILSGDIATFSCKNNNLKYSAKCLNGSLIMEENCDAKDQKLSCLAPPKLLNGYNKYSSTQHGSKVLYQCLNGYELSKGNAELRCDNGAWIGSIPNCSKMSCAFPGNLENGKIFYVGTMAEYAYHPYMNALGQNKQIRYECEKGFKLIGPNGSTCINGNWKPSIKLVKCEKDELLVALIYSNETIKSDLDENIISIGLKNDRKAKSLFTSNDKSVGMKRRKSKKYLKLRRINMKRKNGTFLHDQTAVRRKSKNHYISTNQTLFQ